MPAPLVIPMAENMSSFTNMAEKANHVSENKCKLVVGILENKQTEKLAKLTKEMNELKYELSKIKPTLGQGKRNVVKEAGRNSPLAKVTKTLKCEIPRNNNEENFEPKRRSKAGKSKAERVENNRITNLQRRYTCQLGDEAMLNAKKPVAKSSAQKR